MASHSFAKQSLYQAWLNRVIIFIKKNKKAAYYALI